MQTGAAETSFKRAGEPLSVGAVVTPMTLVVTWAALALLVQPVTASNLPEQPPPLPPPPRGLHLSGESAELKFGLNRECTIEYRPGPPPYLELGCPIQAPPQPPSLPPSPLPPPSPPPPSSPPPQAPPVPQLYMVGGHIARQGQVGDINSYDTVLNQWTKLTAVLPQERSAGTAVRWCILLCLRRRQGRRR
jgi:hypothetical protein